jgi:hypothetical protein
MRVCAVVCASPQILMREFGFRGYNKWQTLGHLCISILVLWCICYVPIRFVTYQKR